MNIKWQVTFTGTYDEYILDKKYGLKIGDYVNYTYDTVSDGYFLSKTYSGYTSNQTLTQAVGLQWRVMGLDENGNIELISATPAKDCKVYLGGAAGYNNGVYLLNDICLKLYSNSDLGISARSLKLEDIEEQFSSKGIIAKNTFKGIGPIYGETKTLSSKQKYPVLYAEEMGSGVTGVIREGGIGRSEPFYEEYNDLTSAYNTTSGSLTATQTYYYFSSTPRTYLKNETFHSMIFGTGETYWLASRCVDCVSSWVSFSLYYINYANLITQAMYVSGSGVEYNYNRYLRPVITLPSNISVDTSTGNGTADSMYSLNMK